MKHVSPEIEQPERPRRFPKRFERILDQVDFDTMQNVFRNIARDVGANSNIDRLVRRRIYKEDRLTTAGSVNVHHRKIYLSPFQARGEYLLKFKNRNSLEGVFLSGLFHEETHLAGGYSEETMEEEIMGRLHARDSSQTGFKKSIEEGKIKQAKGSFDGKSTYQAWFTLLNEATTDCIAEEAFTEYTKQAPVVYKKGAGMRSVQPEEYNRGYTVGRFLLSAIIERLAKECIGSASEEAKAVVWGGIKRAYFDGANLESNEMKELFSSSISSGFLEKLGKASSHASPSTYEALGELLGKKWTEEIKNRWINLFKNSKTK